MLLKNLYEATERGQKKEHREYKENYLFRLWVSAIEIIDIKNDYDDYGSSYCMERRRGSRD